MKISRKSVVKADHVLEEEGVNSVEIPEELEPVQANPHERVCEMIMEAINELSALPDLESDQSAKEAIANLSVVYFDLK